MNENTVQVDKEMIYDINEAVRNLNRVEGFEPKDYLRKDDADGSVKFYLDTKYRLLWYRLVYRKGKLIKIPKVLAKDHATFEVRVYADINDPVDNFLANGFGSCYRDPENKEFGEKFVETAETFALGRALKDAGFGTQFCDVAIANDVSVVDSPIIIPETISDESGNSFENEDSLSSAVVKTETTESEASDKNVSVEKTIELKPNMPIEELKRNMTVEYAKNVRVTVGWDKGRTLGDLDVKKPQSIQFHADRGENNLVKAAAQILLER